MSPRSSNPRRSAWRTAIRSVAWVLAGVVAIAALWYALDLVYVSTGNETGNASPADVIIVLGCPSYEGNIVSDTFSACVQARAHQAARLYHQGLAQHIIPTGGLTGPPPTEAAAMAQVLAAEGVSPSAVFPEEQARDTVGNILYSRAMMQERGWHTAILVTEPHHIRRAAYIARDAGLSFTTSPVTDSPGWHTPSARRDNLLRDARALMTYQFNRLWSGLP